MSLLTTLTRKVAPTVTNLAKGLASKAAPYIDNAKSNLTAGAKNIATTVNKNVQNQKPLFTNGKPNYTVDPTGMYATGAKLFSTAVSKVAPKMGASVSSGFKSSASNFAEKMADVSTKYAGEVNKGGTVIPRVNPNPLKSGSVDQRVFSDIRPNAKPNVTTKTNTARNSTLDTRTTPTKVNTTKTNVPVKNADIPTKGSFPLAKTGLGLGATGLGLAGVSALMPGEQTAKPFNDPSYDGANFTSPTGEQTQQSSGGLSPDAVFGNNEGGVFESPTPAPQTGTQMGGSLQPGFASFGLSGGNMGGVGVGSGIGGSGGGQYKADTNEYITDEEKKRYYRNDAEDRVVAEGDKEQAKKERDARNSEEALRQQQQQITDYNKRIAALMNNQASYGIDLEGSAASSSAREGLADMFDRETRKSLIPLQTSLALVQAERDRMDKLRQQEFENQQSLQTGETKGFTLGNDQQRFEIDPTTGEYKMVGQGFRSTDKPNESPTSIQEYEYARNQGYTGTYNDFQQQNSSNSQTGDKLLTPTEAASLGVPYGTTQSQAYGQNPSKLSGDAAKVQAIASTMIPEINALKQRFTQNYKGALTGLLTGTDRELVKLVDQIADKVGRLRSGGAVNADEEMRFKRQIASLMDLPFGNSQQAITALDGLINEAQQVSSSIDPYYTGNNYQQTNTTSGFNW